MLRFIFTLAAFTLALHCIPAAASSIGKEGFEAIKKCVMQNSDSYCEGVITADSRELFSRFMSYKLMPCLPTNFSYMNESKANGFTIVKASMPAPENRVYHLRMAFSGQPGDVRLDVPESLRIGLGDKWPQKINMAEQLLMLIRTNAGGSLSCDQLSSLIKK